MNEILSFYVIDSKGKTVFLHENYVKNSDALYHALLSNFVIAIQDFVQELGEKESRVIQFGNSQIITSLDSNTNFRFVLKCEKGASFNMVDDILFKIKELFVNKFSDYINEFSKVKDEIIDDFTQNLNNLLYQQKNIDTFLDAL